MSGKEHPSTDRWRVVVTRRNECEILFVESNQSLALPEVQIPSKQRIAWHLNDQLKRVWQLSVVSSLPLPVTPNTAIPVRYHLAELLVPDAGLPSNLRWLERSIALKQFVLDPQDKSALDAATGQEPRNMEHRGPFGRVGWFQDVSLWLRSAAAALALEWEGDFEQFNATDSFSLIRFATKPIALWFKAVGATFATDFHVSRLLSRKLPDFVPRLVATRPDWFAWLSEECPGNTLDAVSDFSLWQNAATMLARLQIASAEFVSELLDARAYPLNTILSPSGLARFHPIVRDVLAADAQSAHERITDDELADIEQTLRQSIDTASYSRLPDALGHLDLNSGNVIVSPDHCAYLDWAEAYIGFPFLSFEYLLQSFRRIFGATSLQEQKLVEMYLSPWESVVRRDAVREAWAVTPVLAVSAYFLRCIDRCEGQILSVPGRLEYLSFLLRKLKREAARAKPLRHGAPQ
jgi:hypothetical protein